MIVTIIAHKQLHERGGGEKSMSIIARYLADKGYRVKVWHENNTYSEEGNLQYVLGPMEGVIAASDVVVSWGRPALKAFYLSKKHSKGFILCVRWWRNVVDVSFDIGNLMTCPIDATFNKTMKPMFQNAFAVITNNYYSAGVIERHYGVKAIVSYVPILGDAKKLGRKDGAIVAISPNKDIGEQNVILDIAAQMPNEEFIIINPGNQRYYRNNIEIVGYQKDLTAIWSRAKLMIQPIYYNDICGTLRTTIEAQQHGVPVIASNRSGVHEKVSNLVSYSADTQEWVREIRKMNADWEQQSKEASYVFEQYDTPGQLKIFEEEIKKAVYERV